MSPSHRATTLPLCQRLRRDDFLHFRHPLRLRLKAVSGTLWVTVDGEPGDIQIDAGESRELEAGAPVTVGTLGGDAALCATALPDAPAARGAWMGLAAWLHLPLPRGVAR